MGAQHQPCQLHIRNVHLLPAFYMLPAEFVMGGASYREGRDAHTRPYRNMPRNPYEALLDAKWRAEIEKEKFAAYVIDALSYLIWPVFEEKDKLNTFSSDEPLWKLAFQAGIESIGVLKEYGYTKDAMLRIPRGYRINYISYAEAQELMTDIGKRLIAQNGWQELIEYIKKNRCFEDFNGTRSKDYLSFYRSWHRTRFCEWVSYNELATEGLQSGAFRTDGYSDSIFDIDYKSFTITTG